MPADRTAAADRARAAAAPLAGCTILAQICYPLLHGSARHVLIAVIVLAFAAASEASALAERGPRAAVALAVVAGAGGFAAEVLGVHTGIPFGRYRYLDALGPKLFDVPLLVAAAWVMFAWPAAVVAAHLTDRPWLRVAIGGWALASWDLFLDPQLVAAGGWQWQRPFAHLPGVPTVPLTNFGGWLLVALVVSALLQPVVRGPSTDDGVPLVLFVWTWPASVLALAAFLDLPWAALWGGIAMGLVAVPLLHRMLAT